WELDRNRNAFCRRTGRRRRIVWGDKRRPASQRERAAGVTALEKSERRSREAARRVRSKLKHVGATQRGPAEGYDVEVGVLGHGSCRQAHQGRDRLQGR